MTIGTEHEYSVNDGDYRPLSVADKIIEEIAGKLENEVPFGPVHLSKELQKHVIEFTPAEPAQDLIGLEAALVSGLKGFFARTGDKYRLLGLGMHPLLRLDEAFVWDHEDKEIYDAYDCLFNIRQHGWLNIQALQVNVPYRNDEDMVAIYNRIRSLIPFLVAISASSPFVEGEATGTMDTRLVYYRENQKQLPIIAHGVIPEKLRSAAHHRQIQDEIHDALREHGGERLCHEWVDSRGVIIRQSRCCVELKAVDEQECVRSDMAITSFLLSLLRSDIRLEEDEDGLREMTEKAIERGVAPLRPELRRLLRSAKEVARPDERRFLPLVETKIESGSLAEVMMEEARQGRQIKEVLQDMERSLRLNTPYQCASCVRSSPY
ncbi:MAG TPA: glutamate-cysteine ligase family protein [Methanomassiliicoccales archaeon]|nr:glutamate-cysteine ligase family protein [Methanomassiliicoccales archaeon]